MRSRSIPIAGRGPVTIGAAQLFEAYHADPQAAGRRFGDREMVVSGAFVRTVPDGYGSIDMRLKTNHPEIPLGIDLDGVSVDAATKLEPGGGGNRQLAAVLPDWGRPLAEDCLIQPPAKPKPGPPTPPGRQLPRRRALSLAVRRPGRLIGRYRSSGLIALKSNW